MEEEKKHTTKETYNAVVSRTDDGNAVVNEYVLVKKLGEGAFGKVKLCRHGSKEFAVKIYRKALLRRKKEYYKKPDGKLAVRTAMEDVAREIAVMKRLTHQNVLKLHEVIDDGEGDKVYMLMDYCPHGPIMDWDADARQFVFPWMSGTELSEQQLRKCVRDMVCGLEYLHSKQIVHRDIKPQNVLLSNDWVVKIGDFGQAMIFEGSDVQKNSVGTYFFFSPEMCSGSGGYSAKAADIWALGLTIYLMVYSKFPFWSDNVSDLFAQICSFELTFDETIDPELEHLLQRLLDKNPETRIKMWEIIQNPWLNRDCNPLRRSLKEVITPTAEEVQSALKPLRGIAFAKVCGRKWRNRARRASQQ